jgi:hypothetical protein
VWSQLRARADADIEIVYREIAKVVHEMNNLYHLCVRTTVDDLVRSEAIVKRCIEINVRPDEVRDIEELRARGGVLPEESDDTFFKKYLDADTKKNVHTFRAMQRHHLLLIDARLKLEERIALY